VLHTNEFQYIQYNTQSNIYINDMPWYDWKIAELALNNSHSLLQMITYWANAGDIGDN
jgi:hypothetical protein